MKPENTGTLTIAELLEEDTQRQFPMMADCHHPNVYYVEEDVEENEQKDEK